MAGVGPLSGKGSRVIVFADASVLSRSVFVRGDATSFEQRAGNIDIHDHTTHHKIKAALKLLALREQHLLVQFWSPRVVGKQHQLTTIDQPFGFGLCDDQRLNSYRKDSKCKIYDVDVGFNLNGSRVSGYGSVCEAQLCVKIRVDKYRNAWQRTRDLTSGFTSSWFTYSSGNHGIIPTSHFMQGWIPHFGISAAFSIRRRVWSVGSRKECALRAGSKQKGGSYLVQIKKERANCNPMQSGQVEERSSSSWSIGSKQERRKQAETFDHSG
ncbi:hypothetical protein Tco_0839126 [Tanacetum coccineum]|uniref:Uncharacterized protein n=1 Tax=Tanacetum coccineum TaxID=301880 RepID=A0ABQ5AU97_9ASTR